MRLFRRRSQTKAFLISAFGILAMAMALSACGGGSDSSSGSTDGSTEGGSTTPADLPASARPEEEATGDPVKIGLIVDEGGTAVSQPEAREAGEGAADYANEQLNGIAGHPIEIVNCQTKEEPAAAANCANQMIQEEVAGVVVPITGQGAAMAPPLSKAGISYLIPTGAAPAEYTLPGIFNVTSGLAGVLAGSAEYAKMEGIKSVTMFPLSAGSFVATVESIAGPAYEAAGVDLNVVAMPAGTPDATPQITAGLKSNPEALYILSDPNGCLTTLKAIEAVGSSADLWLGSTCSAPSVTEAVSPELLEETTEFVTQDSQTDDPEAVTYQWVMSEFAPDAPASGPAEQAYQGMLSLVRATAGIKGEVNAASVLKAMKATDKVPLPIGHGLTFSCNEKQVPGLPAVCGEGSLVAKVKSGKVTEIIKLKH
jgi:branched-chain amino acid transport system substrate-binding protein